MSSFGGVGGVGRIDIDGDWLLTIVGDPEVHPTGNRTGYTFRFALEPRLHGFYLLITELDAIRERGGSTIGIGADSNGVTLSDVRPEQAREAVAMVHEGVAAFNSALQRERAQRAAFPPGVSDQEENARADELAEVRAAAVSAHRDLSGG